MKQGIASTAVSLDPMKGYLQSIRFSSAAFLPIALLCVGAVSLAGISVLLAANIVPAGGNQAPGLEIEKENEREKGNMGNPSPTCVIERSACPPNDPSCLSPVSIEQIPCSDARCATGACTRMTIHVDKGDNIGKAKVNPFAGPPQTDLSASGETSGNHQETETPIMNPGAPIGTTTTQGPILGCFAEDGSWTSDRSLCAVDQARFPQGQPPPLPQGLVEISRETSLQIEEQFVPDTRRTALVQNLLSLTIEAVGRLSLILENPTLSPDLRMNLSGTMEWLRAIQRTVSEEDHSINDLQMLADEVGKRLVDTRLAVIAWVESSGRTSLPPPQTLTDKMDKILMALPSAFSLLQAEMIMIPDVAISGFVEAQAVYEIIKPTCLSNSDTCGELNKVVDLLVPVVAALKTAIDTAGRSDLEAQIDLLMQ